MTEGREASGRGGAGLRVCRRNTRVRRAQRGHTGAEFSSGRPQYAILGRFPAMFPGHRIPARPGWIQADKGG